MEHIPNITVLFVGRILGGVSTNLLFSAFESWMVAEHRKLGFSEDLLQSTFIVSSWGNGLVAIVAGFIAQWSVTTMNYGDIGPFQVAILLTIVCLVLIVLFWGENYGNAHKETEVEVMAAVISPSKKSSAGKGSTASPVRRSSRLADKEGSNQSSATRTAIKDVHGEVKSAGENESIYTLLLRHPEICLLGLSQACFEGAVYSFGKWSLFSIVYYYIELN